MSRRRLERKNIIHRSYFPDQNCWRHIFLASKNLGSHMLALYLIIRFLFPINFQVPAPIVVLGRPSIPVQLESDRAASALVVARTVPEHYSPHADETTPLSHMPFSSCTRRRPWLGYRAAVHTLKVERRNRHDSPATRWRRRDVSGRVMKPFGKLCHECDTRRPTRGHKHTYRGQSALAVKLARGLRKREDCRVEMQKGDEIVQWRTTFDIPREEYRAREFREKEGVKRGELGEARVGTF